MRPTWLQAVADVLNADTGDLRRLAEIAGANPATLYIGTSLDGVDIRGQDLRGMSLPGLDLGKVQSDAATQLDAALTPTSGVMVWVADGRENGNALGRTIASQVYDAHEDARFLQAAAGHEGPILVILTPRSLLDAIPVAEALGVMNRSFVSIVVEGRKSWDPLQRHSAAAKLSPLVFVQRITGPFAQVAGFGGETRDLIALLALEWEKRMELLHPLGTNFLRASGSGSDRLGDAAAQVFDRMCVLEAPLSSTSLVQTRRSRDRRSDRPHDIATALLSPARIRIHPAPANPSFDIAAFGPIASQTSVSPVDRLTKALHRVGWNAELTSDPRGQNRIQIESRGRSFLIVEEAKQPTMKRSVEPHPNQGFHLENALIVIAPSADLGVVATRHLETGDLLVNARDLLAWPLGAESVWLLLAAQMRRLSRTANGSARLLYLRMLLRSALDAGGVDSDHRSLVERMLFDPYFLEHFGVSILGYAMTDRGAVCTLRMRGKADAETPVRLEIDARGVVVTASTTDLSPR